jgi:hypothetical protein
MNTHVNNISKSPDEELGELPLTAIAADDEAITVITLFVVFMT